MNEVKCEICNERTAIVHVQQIIGNKISDLHICEVCAHKKGISTSNDKIELSLSQLITGLVDLKSLASGEGLLDECPNCGTQIEDFRKNGKVGCIDCYNSFRKEIVALLDNMTGGAVRHKGKLPEKLRTYKTLLLDKEKLKVELKDAVKKEDYETAAVLRDRISELENMDGKK